MKDPIRHHGVQARVLRAVARVDCGVNPFGRLRALIPVYPFPKGPFVGNTLAHVARYAWRYLQGEMGTLVPSF